MVKQAGGTLFTDDFLDRSDLPQFRGILSYCHKAVFFSNPTAFST
jgi:hypothetical protein